MADFRLGAPAAGGLHAAHRGRLDQSKGKTAVTLVESATLLGADPPHRHSSQKPAI